MYVNHRYEYTILAPGTTLADTGDKGTFHPGIAKHIVRGVAVVLITEPTAAGVIKFDKLDLASAARGDGDVAVIDIAAGHNIGEVVYKSDLNVEIKPGEAVVCESTTGTAGLTSARVVLYLELVWEQPANNPVMFASVAP